MIALLLPPVILTAALGAAVWPWSASIGSERPVRLLATMVGVSAMIVALEVTLGATGRLSPGWLRAAATATAILLGGGAAFRSRRGRPSPGFSGRRPVTRAGALLGGFAALAYAVLLGVGTLVPPYGWDTLVYHLTDVFHATRTQSLDPFPFPGRMFFFPMVGELHSLWAHLLSGAGAESWRTTGVALIPFGLTAGVAVRVAADALGLREARSWVVPAVMLTPIVMIQPLSGYVDTMFAAFLLASFAFALLAAQSGRTAHVAMAALAGGLALGTKLSFVVLGLPVLVVLAGRAPWRGTLGGGYRRAAPRFALLALLFLAGSAPWLARNAANTGNPVHPTPVTVGAITLLKGPLPIEGSTRQESWFVESPAGWATYPFHETFHGRPAWTLENGFGPLFAAGFVLALPAFALACRRRQWVAARAHLALPLTLAAWLLATPWREPRYAIAACGFSVLAVAAVYCETARRAAPRRLATGAVTFAILFAGIGGMASAVPELGRVLERARAGEWSPGRYYEMQYGAAGRAFNWIAENTPPGDTVTFTNASFIAPLFGWHGRNGVVYSPTMDDPPVGPAPRIDDYRAWQESLDENSVRWVVVWVPWWEETGSPVAETWVANHPERFELVRDFEGRARVYRTTPPGGVHFPEDRG